MQYIRYTSITVFFFFMFQKVYSYPELKIRKTDAKKLKIRIKNVSISIFVVCLHFQDIISGSFNYVEQNGFLKILIGCV